MRNLLFIFGVLYGSLLQAEPLLTFKDAYIVEAPPTATVMVAYMTIVNASDQEQEVVSISGDDFASVEMHRTEIKEGVARMLPQSSLIIPANSEVKLEPGGLHLMLNKPKQHLLEGELSLLKIKQRDDTLHGLVVKVRKRYSQDHNHHHHH